MCLFFSGECLCAVDCDRFLWNRFASDPAAGFNTLRRVRHVFYQSLLESATFSLEVFSMPSIFSMAYVEAKLYQRVVRISGIYWSRTSSVCVCSNFEYFFLRKWPKPNSLSGFWATEHFLGTMFAGNHSRSIRRHILNDFDEFVDAIQQALFTVAWYPCASMIDMHMLG